MSSSSLAADCLKWDWYWSGNLESTDWSRWFFMSPANLHLNVRNREFYEQDSSLEGNKSPWSKLLFLLWKPIPFFCSFLYMEDVFFNLHQGNNNVSREACHCLSSDRWTTFFWTVTKAWPKYHLLKTSAEIRSQQEHGPVQVNLVKRYC